MIRINLLPFRAARRKENIRRQVSVFVLLIIFFILSLTYYTLSINKKIISVKADISNVKQQIRLYRQKANRVTDINKKLKIMKKKLDIVKDLQAKRREPLILLNKMSKIVVPKRMWLTSLKTDNTHVKIKGIAFDNKTVADFMTRLEASSLFISVDLKNLRMKNFGKTMQMKKFEIICMKTGLKTDKNKKSEK